MEQRIIHEFSYKFKEGTATPEKDASVKVWLHLSNEAAEATGLSVEELAYDSTETWTAIQSTTRTETRRV